MLADLQQREENSNASKSSTLVFSHDLSMLHASGVEIFEI